MIWISDFEGLPLERLFECLRVPVVQRVPRIRARNVREKLEKPEREREREPYAEKAHQVVQITIAYDCCSFPLSLAVSIPVSFPVSFSPYGVHRCSVIESTAIQVRWC